MVSFLTAYLAPCLSAFLACLGFTFIFNIHGAEKIIGGLGGALGWLVYLLAGKTIFSAFLASAVIGVYSEIIARLRRCPVTGCLLVALLPLVPGSGIYYAMRSCMAGDTQQFLSKLLHTLGFAAALAVGAMLSSSLFRTIVPHLHRFGQKKR